MMKYLAAIFDLDGVLVDTAKLHYKAWKQLANELGIAFTQKDNEGLKGVSRMECMEVILKIGNLQMSESEKIRYTNMKNNIYRQMLENDNESILIAGAVEYVKKVKALGIKTAIGSASKNTMAILEKCDIEDLFDCIVDGTMVIKTKPDPEVFVKGAKRLGMNMDESVVFEDSKAGIEAAKKCGMLAIGIGDRENLLVADEVYKSLELTPISMFI